MGTYVKNLVGQVFHSLTVLKRIGQERRYACWQCRCECGVEVVVRGDRLRNGRKKYCSSAKHMSNHTALHPLTYSSWSSMKLRCADTSGKNFRNYGSRGIVVCERWQGFEAFLADMNERPGPEYTLDRIDVNGNYEPGNCRWATASVQRRNSRDTVFIEHLGEKIKLSDFCDKHGLDHDLFRGRIDTGWSVDLAMTLPKGTHRKTFAKAR